MKTTIYSLAFALGLSVLPAYSQTVGDDAKDAAHDTKTAVKKGYKKSTHGVKKGYKKSTHATKSGVNKAADKVADKTDTTK
jgi:hypothetical protein